MFRRGSYEELPGINWSKLKSMRVSPMQYLHDLKAEQEDKEALRIGLAAHAYILEPELFSTRFVCYREDKSKGEGARKKWYAFKEQAEKEGKVILSPDEHDRAVGAAQAVLAHPVAIQFFTGGSKEMAWQWTDEATGLLCKGRCDQWLRKMVELKTTRNIIPRLFAQDAARLGYHAQAAFYVDGLRAHGVDVDDEPIMVTVQNVTPHDVVVYRIPGYVIDIGRDLYRELLIRLKHCQACGVWPGVVPEQPVDFELPEWAVPKEDLELVMPDGEVVAS